MSGAPVAVTLFVNDDLGIRVSEFLLADSSTDVTRIIVNDPPKRRLPLDLERLSASLGVPVVSYSEAWESEVETQNMDSLGVSVLFGHILSNHQIGCFSRGVINCHPSLLPYNRGAFPAAWSIMDGSPSGVTIHFMDEGVDTGSILIQTPVQAFSSDTSGTLYARTLETLYETFTMHWSEIREGTIQSIAQTDTGTYHSSREFHQLRQFCTSDTKSVEEFLLRLRATSLLDGSGAQVTLASGEVFEIRVDLKSLN